MRLAVACALLIGLAIHAGPGWAHENAPLAFGGNASPEVTRAIDGLTQRLLDLQGQHQRATDADVKKSALHNLLAVAAARQQRLAALIEDHPGAVIKAALPTPVRAALPPEALRYVEEDVTLEGELDVLHEDRPDGGRYVHWLSLGATRLSLNFAAQVPLLQSGDRVRVRALRVRQALAVGGGSQVSVLAAAAGNTFGAQRTAVILIAFSNQPGVSSTTASHAQEVVFGAGASVSNFFYEASYQQTSLSGSVFGPYTIPISGTGTACDYYGIAKAAEQAATAAGVSLSSFPRRVYAFPSNGCGWWGLGTVGGSPSMAWINGGFQNGVVAHEMGHNLGLYHSHALECGAATIAASCSSVEYGDVLDTMGSASPPKHFNAAQKERLGWLGYGASPAITTVQSSGTYTIDRYESMGGASKALKVLSSAGDWYYVEYRQAIGFDASAVTGNANVLNGVVVHMMEGNDANAIYLLDMTPATSSWSDPALGVGQSFVDVTGGITISPLWTSGTDAGISITLGPSACVRQNPSIVISPAQQQGAASVAVTYTLSVRNNDTGCTASSFGQTVTVPSGWTATFGAGPLSIGSGASASTTLSVKAPASVPAGSYAVVPRVSNASLPAYAASGSATYVVPSACTRQNPTVSVSPAKQRGAPGVGVTYGVTVTNNDSGCGATSFNQNASVPSGWTATFASSALSINSGATVSTTLNVKPPASAAPGTYDVVPRSTNAMATTFAGAAAASYEVSNPCVRKAPTMTVSPALQQGAPNVPVTYTVSVTNNDTGCASSSFSQDVTAPAGWTAAFGAGALSANPGATVSTTLNVKPPASAAVGTYAIVPKATNTAAASLVSSATATYAVAGSGGGTGVAVTFSDDFARADSDTLGHGWVAVSGAFSVKGGELRSGPTRALHMAILPEVAGSKELVAASFASTDSAYSLRFGLIMRYSDVRNYYMCYRMTGGTSVLRISKVVDGLEIVLKSTPIANPAKDAMFRLTCSADASTLSLELGSSRLTVPDPGFSSGRVGLVMGSVSLLGGKGPSLRADDFTASVQ